MFEQQQQQQHNMFFKVWIILLSYVKRFIDLSYTFLHHNLQRVTTNNLINYAY